MTGERMKLTCFHMNGEDVTDLMVKEFPEFKANRDNMTGPEWRKYTKKVRRRRDVICHMSDTDLATYHGSKWRGVVCQ
ncbi:unnamed protein product [Sympodiomycopsis kandeliae]